jgi:hypothetical protein
MQTSEIVKTVMATTATAKIALVVFYSVALMFFAFAAGSAGGPRNWLTRLRS